MAYIVSQIAGKIRNRIRDSGYSTTETLDYMNDTQNDVFNEYRLSFMEATQDYTLTAGVSDITNGSGLPANYVQALDLVLTTTGREKVLPYRDIRTLDDLHPDADDQATHPRNVPQFWYHYAETIRVFPEPNDAYTVTLRYYKKPTLLAADADVPEIPSEFEELLVLGAAYRILQVKDNYDQAGILENKYTELLEKLVFKYSQKQVGTPARMRINRYAQSPSSF